LRRETAGTFSPPFFVRVDPICSRLFAGSSSQWRIAMAKRPPVPPANRSPKGPGSDPKITPDDKQRDDPNANQREQGDHANVSQNTTNRGHHQGKG
jgi:hypothetical protein